MDSRVPPLIGTSCRVAEGPFLQSSTLPFLPRMGHALLLPVSPTSSGGLCGVGTVTYPPPISRLLSVDSPFCVFPPGSMSFHTISNTLHCIPMATEDVIPCDIESPVGLLPCLADYTVYQQWQLGKEPAFSTLGLSCHLCQYTYSQPVFPPFTFWSPNLFPCVLYSSFFFFFNFFFF